MKRELIRQLLEAGVHFGHQTKRWNPKMKKFIFGQRSGIYIIDLEKTEECLLKAKEFVINLCSSGGIILFVGTKRQAQQVIREEATRANASYVNQRWIGGLLTNFSTIRKTIDRLCEIENLVQTDEFKMLNKKEQARTLKELERLRKNFSGLKALEKLPDALFIIDPRKEEIALREANRMSIPTLALIDTNGDPDKVSYPIPGNDDAIKSIKFICSLVADWIIEGRKIFLSYLAKEQPQQTTEVPSTKAQEELVGADDSPLDEGKDKT